MALVPTESLIKKTNCKTTTHTQQQNTPTKVQVNKKKMQMRQNCFGFFFLFLPKNASLVSYSFDHKT